MTVAIVVAVSILAYFLIGISTFCWGIRNLLLNSGRPKLWYNNPSYWFDWLGSDDILFCSVMGAFWPITFLAVVMRWLWKHLLVKIIIKSIERKLRKEKKTDK